MQGHYVNVHPPSALLPPLQGGYTIVKVNHFHHTLVSEITDPVHPVESCGKHTSLNPVHVHLHRLAQSLCNSVLCCALLPCERVRYCNAAEPSARKFKNL